MSATVGNYEYAGAQAMVQLHECHLRSCVATWHQAFEAGVRLPDSEHDAYASMETLLTHLLSAARHYMTWACEQLALPDPGIRAAPRADQVLEEVEGFVEHLLERWRTPLSEVPKERFVRQTFKSRWGVDYSVDAMLEHAVMHPIRHQHQLLALIESQAGSAG